jgi:rod shape-determining protein MreB and related proteins
VETAVDLISRYEPDFQEAVRQNIYLAGGGSQIRGLADSIEAALKEYGPAKVQTVDDALFSGASGALALAQDMPEEYWEDM